MKDLIERPFEYSKDELITILRLKQVMDITGMGKSTIYDRMKRGAFPKQIKLDYRTVGWFELDIGRYLHVKKLFGGGDDKISMEGFYG